MDDFSSSQNEALRFGKHCIKKAVKCLPLFLQVCQKHPASQVIPEYDLVRGTAIVIKDFVHRMIPRSSGTYTGTARQLLGKDAKDLRNVGVPNTFIQRLIDAAKAQFPGTTANPAPYTKPPRVKKT